MARTGKTVSELVGNLPRYTMLKHYVKIEPNLLYSAIQNARDKSDRAGAAEIDFSDGVKLTWPDGWVHIRASNTESMIRVIAEAEDEKRVRELMNWAVDRLK